MSEKNLLFVLGASDPEMAEIEAVLAAAGQRFVYAMVGMGESVRVHPGNAYKFAGLSGEFGDEDTVVLVECEPEPGRLAVLTASREMIRVDHHRPGDPGYGQPPEKFFEASSLGQIRALLARITGVGFHEADENERHAMVAAADHCLEAAYRGKCPGVDPDRLMWWRTETRAAFQKRPVEAVLADIETARKRLQEAVAEWTCPECGGSKLDQYTGTETCQYCGGSGGGGPYEVARFDGMPSIPELSEAAAREGIPFVATVKEKDGREKVVLQSATSDLVRRFKDGKIIPGLTGVYGDPARGFAGGYVAK